MPVTATRGRPCCRASRSAMSTSLKLVVSAHRAFAAPMPDGGHERLAGLPGRDQRGGERHAGGRLPFHRMADHVAGRVDRRAGREVRAEPPAPRR